MGRHTLLQRPRAIAIRHFGATLLWPLTCISSKCVSQGLNQGPRLATAVQDLEHTFASKQKRLKVRSELVFAARQTMKNRFALCQTAAKATRKFHRTNTCIQDTTNKVLRCIAESDQESATLRCDSGLAYPRGAWPA